MNNQVTICMSAYNAEKYIKQTVKSIQNQTYKNWDLVIVDDGSKDKTNQLCAKFASDDSRIHLITQTNMGLPGARRTGVFSKVAKKNEWIMFCDADDILPKDAIQKLIETAVQYDTDMVCGTARKIINGRIVSGNNTGFFNIIEPRQYKHSEIISEVLCYFFGLQGFPVNLWGKIYRRKYIEDAIKYNSVVQFTGEDLVVTLQVVANINSMVLIPDIVYHYRIGGGSSRYSPTLLDDFVSLYRFRLPYIEKYPMRQDVRWFMDVELMYYTQTYLVQQVRKNGIDTIEKEIIKLNSIPEIKSVAETLSTKEANISEYAAMLYKNDVNEIAKMINTKVRKGRKRELLKRFLIH